MPTTDQLAEELAMLKEQQALLTLGLRQILEGRFTGATGAAGTVVQLEGGQTSVDVAPFLRGG